MIKRRLIILLLIAATLTGLPACSATPARESIGEFLDSSMITAKIKTRLVDDRITGGFRIRVTTFKGIVRLSGEVNSRLEKERAGHLATSVNGVERVENLLEVRAYEARR